MGSNSVVTSITPDVSSMTMPTNTRKTLMISSSTLGFSLMDVIKVKILFGIFCIVRI